LEQELIRESDRYGTTEMQQKLLPMMREFDALMRKNDISYTLCGGAMLGAVRNGRFIPWDDDLDIMLDRENYIKMLRMFHDPEKRGNFRIFDRLWVYRIVKKDDYKAARSGSEAVPTIDVFVMDPCPKSKWKKSIKILLLRLLQGMMHTELKPEGFSAFHKVLLAGTYYFGRLFTKRFKFRLYDRLEQLWSSEEGYKLGGYNDLFKNLPHEYDPDLMDHIKYITLEGMQLPIPENYDPFLRESYGDDYMTPPPEKDRIPVHL